MGAALADGFQPLGPYVPGMGWHFLNEANVGAAMEDGLAIERPQLLVYADTGDHVALVSAEYALPLDNPHGYSADDPPDLFSDEGADAEEHWHVLPGAQPLFATGDGEAVDSASLTPHDLLTRGRWAALPAGGGDDGHDDHDHDHGHDDGHGDDAAVEPGDEVTADWGITGTEETRVVDLAPPAYPDLLTLHAWVHLPNPGGVFTPANPNVGYVEMLPDGIMSERTAKPGSQR